MPDPICPLTTTCLIAGGGPAGLMAGFLLARVGVPVVVLEKHADFFRDFRGDTIHPSTLEVMRELGLLEAFLTLPHQKVDHISGQFGPDRLRIADFGRLPVAAPYIAMMPQWDFLNFIAEKARALPNFRLDMSAAADDLIEENGVIKGVRAVTPSGPLDIRADLTIGADGRHSTIRERAGLIVKDLGAPMDALWFRLARKPEDTDESLGHFERGAGLVTINRGGYWQCAYVIPKGGFADLQARGLDAFRERIAALQPFPGGVARLADVKSWVDVKLLSVAVDRLETWHKPGLLMIGDAAHAMSPIGGVGVNLAVQDAVAAARILAGPLRAGRVTEADLAAVQRRRMWPTRVTQAIQTTAQRRIIGKVLAPEGGPIRAPWLLRQVTQWSWFRGRLGRLIGLGVQPEHIA